MRIHSTSLGFTLLLGALAGLPALSIDMGLPALPLISTHFGTTSSVTALTLSLFMAGFGAAQLVIGPLSDRIGRRPVLLVALALYTLGGAASAGASSMAMLIVARCLQGAGAAGGTVLAFAIIRDLFDGDAARVRLSTISMVFSLAPVIAPTLGGLVLRFDGWQSIFVVLSATGLVLLLAVGFGLPESIHCWKNLSADSRIPPRSSIRRALCCVAIPAWRTSSVSARARSGSGAKRGASWGR